MNSKIIKNRKDFELNNVFGLSLRFIATIDAINEHILFIDDDILPHPVTILNMFQKYERRQPCIVGKYGRKVLPNLDYSSKPHYDKRSPIALTSLVLVPKKLCLAFIDRMEVLNSFVNEISKPLWNGEDIFLSLLSIYYFNKLPYIVSNDKYFPVMKIDNHKDVAISNDPNHVKYRGQLIKEIIKHFGDSSTKYQGFFANELK